MKDLDYWFPPAEIRFSRFQMLSFLLPNLRSLEIGEYPTEPDEYYSLQGKSRVIKQRSTYRNSEYKTLTWQKRSPHETACLIAGEVNARLKRSPYGEMTYLLANLEEPLQVARKFKLSEDRMNKEYRLTLSYISGWKRNLYTYNEWRLVDTIVRGLSFE